MNYKHVLKVYQWTKNEYAGFEVVELWESESGLSYTTCQYARNENQVKRVNGVSLYCQCNRFGDNRKMYAMDVRMRDDVTMHEIDQREQDVKRIRWIEKKYTAICNRLGYPDTFTQFVAYIADVLNTTIVETSSYDSGDVCKLELYTLKSYEDKLTS